MIERNPGTPTAYLLCGKIGSGKTVAARHIHEETGAVAFNLDQLMEPLFGQTLGRERHVKALAVCAEYAYSIADQILDSGVSVVMDFGFWTRAERRAASERFKGRDVVFVYLAVSDDEQKQRINARNSSIDRTYSFTTDQLSFLNAFFEEPSDSEGLAFISSEELFV